MSKLRVVDSLGLILVIELVRRIYEVSYIGKVLLVKKLNPILVNLPVFDDVEFARNSSNVFSQARFIKSNMGENTP